MPARPFRRKAWIAFGQGNRTLGVGGHCVEHHRVETPIDHVQLVGGFTRRVDVAYRKHDLDISQQEPRAPELVSGRADDATDRRRRRVDPALDQPQEREPRLRFPSQLARALVRLLGRVKFPAQTMHLGLLV